MTDELEWWTRAQALEREDRLDEAEAVIKEGMPPQSYPWPGQVAELYKLRMERLLEAGSPEEAKAAAIKGVHWMGIYTSGATSGGEMAAYTYELEQFRKELRSTLTAHGLDPEEL